MSNGTVSLEWIGATLREMQIEQRVIRTELRDIGTVVLAVAEQGRRLERRIDHVETRMAELKDDLELMIKTELMGRLGHFETQIGHRLDAIIERLDVVEPTPPRT